MLLEGAKGVGKTETASRRAGTVHALDDPAQSALLAQADPRGFAMIRLQCFSTNGSPHAVSSGSSSGAAWTTMHPRGNSS